MAVNHLVEPFVFSISSFSYCNDFAKVLRNGKIYYFGKKQAIVVKQLYEAYGTSSPWVFGKELLYNAGSKSIQMKDLFKKNKSWNDLIISDGQGNYRLN